MGRDYLQIGLEHHRAGRLRQAQSSYLAALGENADDPEANHWLGVLALQAGEMGEAVRLLERAATLKVGDAAYQHNLGQAYLGSREFEKAIGAFQRAAVLEAGRWETLMGLGTAFLGRAGAGDGQEAISAMESAERAALGAGTISAGMLAEIYRCKGMALIAAGRAEEAAEAVGRALAKKPEDAVLYFELAVARRALKQTKEVRKALLKALEHDESLARGWYALAVLEMEDGNLAQSAALLQRAIKARPDYAAAHQGLGHVKERQGKRAEALEAYRQAMRASRKTAQESGGETLTTAVDALEKKLAPDPAIADMHYGLATMMNVFAPPRVPGWAVAALFDRYAETFDEHLQKALHYEIPEMIAQRVAALRPRGGLNILDLGCGTGLCGVALRSMAAELAGVDLSGAMIEKARARGIYDRAEAGDMIEALQKSEREFDLLVAADVLIYMGDLGPVFEGVAGGIRPGGLFVYSVEAGEGDRYELQQKSRRFRHSKGYLERLGAMYGFVEEGFEKIIVRFDAERPVAGYLVILKMPG